MKSKKITIITLGIVISSAIIYSCDTRTYDDIGGVVAHPTYAKDIKPMMQTNCVSCHDQNGSFPDLTNYSGVSDNAETIYSEIESGGMPQGGTKLSNSTIQTFQNWMTDGKPEN